MARTQGTWEEYNGSYVAVPWSEGRDVLIRGASKYLNFGSIVGESGYGVRDNGGTLQFKNSGGSWENFGAGGGAALTVVEGDASPSVSNVDTIVFPNGTVTDDGGGQVTISISGSGDVVGPASAVDDRIVTFDGTTGKLIKDGGATVANVRDRSTHTGTQAASTISDFDTEVSNNTDVAANTAARHAAVTVADSAEIDFTITGQQISASLIAGSIDETKLDTSVNASLDLADSASQPGHTHSLANITDVTASAAELNVLDGIPGTLTATELGYVDGVTSAIQTQLSAKAPLASPSFTGTVTLPTGLTGVLRADSGVVSTDSDVTDLVSAASDTAAGKVELATTAEVNTGTDTGRAVTPDALAGSNFGIRYLQATLNGTTALTTSDKVYFRIPAALNGMNLVSVAATVGTGAAGSSSSGTPTFTVYNVTDAAQMLSTNLTVDASEYTSATAATAAVINTSTDDVATNDLIEVACTVAGTGVTYATVTLGFQLS